jgi:hypothetical protein
VNHPAFVPAGLVVDDEQTRQVGPDIDESFHVVRVGRQAGLGLQRHAHGTDRRQLVIGGIGRRGDCVIVDAREDGREDVRLESRGIEQVVLEQLARLVSFGECALWLIRSVRPRRDAREKVLQRRRQIHNYRNVSGMPSCRRRAASSSAGTA